MADDQSYINQIKQWGRSRYSPRPEGPLSPAIPSCIKMIPMRDGVCLYTEIYKPSNKGCYPVVFHRSPYPSFLPSRDNKGSVKRYIDAGYIFIFQLTRGQGQSEGHYEYYKDDINDGYDSIEWIADQAWCDGNVGMEGSSYAGSVQLLAARSKPDALKCIMPTAFVGNYLSCFPFCGGVPLRSMLMQWYKLCDVKSMSDLDISYGDMRIAEHPDWRKALISRPLIDCANQRLQGDKLKSWREIISNPTDNGFWDAIHYTDDELAELQLPMFITDGWYDVTIGPLNYFERLERMSNNPNHYLLVGPWDHAQTYREYLHDLPHGDYAMPEDGKLDLSALRLAFFDRYLKGKKSSKIQEDRVKVFITGENTWHVAPTFPLPGTKDQLMYLHSKGSAGTNPSDGYLDRGKPNNEPVDTYRYNPDIPTPHEYEAFRDRRHLEMRADMLTYTSSPFEFPITIVGEINLVLYAASDCLDTDWFAMLTEVHPSGKSIGFYSAWPALRARYHKGMHEENPLVPGEPTEFRISLGACGHQIAAGNCLRLSIYSSSFPIFDPNTNTGKCVATDTASQVANQVIFHDATRASHIVLPIIEA